MSRNFRNDTREPIVLGGLSIGPTRTGSCDDQDVQDALRKWPVKTRLALHALTELPPTEQPETAMLRMCLRIATSPREAVRNLVTAKGRPRCDWLSEQVSCPVSAVARDRAWRRAKRWIASGRDRGA